MFHNTLQFDLAQAYIIEKDFRKASVILDEIILNEKFNSDILAKAKIKKEKLLKTILCMKALITTKVPPYQIEI